LGAARPPRLIPSAISLKVVSSRAAGGTLPGMRERHPENATAGERPDASAWLKLPKGIALGVLLAIPFWLILAGLAVWIWG